jgi:hypothetical protein
VASTVRSAASTSSHGWSDCRLPSASRRATGELPPQACSSRMACFLAARYLFNSSRHSAASSSWPMASASAISVRSSCSNASATTRILGHVLKLGAPAYGPVPWLGGVDRGVRNRGWPLASGLSTAGSSPSICTSARQISWIRPSERLPVAHLTAARRVLGRSWL